MTEKTTPSTGNKVDSIVPQDTIKEVLNRAYNQGIDHAIQIVYNGFNGANFRANYGEAIEVKRKIISQLEQLKSK